MYEPFALTHIDIRNYIEVHTLCVGIITWQVYSIRGYTWQVLDMTIDTTIAPRWKTCLRHVQYFFGIPLERAFVKNNFDRRSKRDVSEKSLQLVCTKHACVVSSSTPDVEMV